FFFQAEDGIRDKLVTGVQTCALPICPPLERGKDRYFRTRIRSCRPDSTCPRVSLGRLQPPLARLRRQTRFFLASLGRRSPPNGRSEERRVGKEGRARWSR